MATSSFSRKLFPVFVVLCIAAFAAASEGEYDDELYTYGVTETNQFVTKSFESGSLESASGMSNFASESFASESGELASEASKSDPFVSDNTEYATESVAVTEPLASAETASPSDSEAATSTNPDPSFTPATITTVRTNITVAGDVSTFNPDKFEIDLAKALGVATEQINVLTVTPGSVVALTEITSTPGGPSAQDILNDLIEKVTNGDPSLAGLGIESVTNSDGSVIVPIEDNDDNDSDDGGSDNTGAIVGGVVGGVIGAAAIAGAAAYYLKNKRGGGSGNTEMSSSSPNYNQV